MKKIGLLIIAATLAGCATARQEREAAFQSELPHLVAACNQAYAASASVTREGDRACARLASRGSLGLADQAAARAYMRGREDRQLTGLALHTYTPSQPRLP